VFSYNGSVTAWYYSSGREQSCAAWYKEWNYGTFAEGATYIRLGGHHILTLGIRPHSSFFFFLRLISAIADWMSTILPHMMLP